MPYRNKIIKSKLRFIHSILGWNFYIKQRWKQFIRLMTNTSVLPSMLFGILTLSFTYVFNYTSKEGQVIGDFFPISIIVITVIGIFFTSITFGRYFFQAQPPEVYAEYSIAGTTPSYSFVYIAYCIWKECHFIRKNEDIFLHFNQISLSKDTIEKENFKKKLDRFNKSFQKRYDEIQKINFMIINLSESMYIPPHRVSDFLFQFSPDIYYQEIKNAIHKMNELYFMSSQNIDDEFTKAEKFKKISEDVSNILKAVKKRMKYQKDIILHRDLHNFIINMSSGYGLSDAFGSYCLGLQYSVSKKYDKTEMASQIRNRFLFMYHKRRMYPGFDLHALLYSFVVNLSKKNIKNEKLQKFRKALVKISTNVDKGLDSASTEELSILKENFENLSNTYEDDRNAQRIKIITELKEKIIHILDNANLNSDEKNKILLITQGYSSVVNYCLKEISSDIQVASSENELCNLYTKLKEKNAFLEYYILENPIKDKNKEKVVSRHLRYKFKENPNIPKKSGYKVNVKIGNEEWLNILINEAPETPKIFLSGAEFIQERNNKSENRIINNETIFKYINKLEKKSNRNYKWFVLAEKYKIFPKNLESNLTYKIALSNDYLEELQLCDWSKERIIINGDMNVKKDTFKGLSNVNINEEE